MFGRPHDLQASRAGAVFGGVAGFTPVLCLFLFLRLGLPRDAAGAVGLVSAILLIGGGGGAFYGIVGGPAGRWLRDRRGAAWTDFRAAALGGWLFGTVGAGLCWAFY